METKYTTAGREWKVGERVILVSTSNMSAAPRVRPIERVNPKSITVDGERFRTDELTQGLPVRRNGTGWGSYTVTVSPLDSPNAPYLLAERALYKQWRLVHAATEAWEKDRQIEHAETLRAELDEWIQARKAYDAERLKLEGDGGR